MEKNQITEITVHDWLELKHIFRMFNFKWVFRGERDSTYQLKPSIKKAIDLTKFQNDNINIPLMEKNILEEFKKGANYFLTKIPDTISKDSTLKNTFDGVLEWLSLMQHYGAPTRLIDWSKSPYVATYFSINEVNEKVDEKHCAVWAINKNWLNFCNKFIIVKGNDSLIKDGGNEKEPLIENIPCLLYVVPKNLNERMIAQQGIFLWIGDIDKSVAENLNVYNYEKMKEEIIKKMGEDEDYLKEEIKNSDLICRINDERIEKIDYKDLLSTKRNIIKINIPRYLRGEILDDLNKMNINQATLFPDMDGYAKYLSKTFISKIANEKSSRPIHKTVSLERFLDSNYTLNISIPNNPGGIRSVTNAIWEVNNEINIESLVLTMMDRSSNWILDMRSSNNEPISEKLKDQLKTNLEQYLCNPEKECKEYAPVGKGHYKCLKKIEYKCKNKNNIKENYERVHFEDLIKE